MVAVDVIVIILIVALDIGITYIIQKYRFRSNLTENS